MHILLKISITYNKKQIPLLNLLINWVLARSAPQILSRNDEYSFLFLKNLCNSSANSLFGIFSF